MLYKVLNIFGRRTVTCDGNLLKLWGIKFLSKAMKPLEKPSDLSVTEHSRRAEATYNLNHFPGKADVYTPVNAASLFLRGLYYEERIMS